MPSRSLPISDAAQRFGRDAGRRLGTFLAIWASFSMLGIGLTLRVTEPSAPSRQVVATIIDPHGPNSASVETTEELRRAISSPDVIEAALMSRHLVHPDNARLLAARVAARLRVAAALTPDKGQWQITLAETPGLTSADAAAVVNWLADNYQQEDRAVRLGKAERQHAAAAKQLKAVEELVVQSRATIDELIEHWVVAVSAAANRQASVVRAAPVQPAGQAIVETAEMKEVREQLAELGARREQLLERCTPAHPDVVEVDRHIETLQTQLASLRLLAQQRQAAMPVAQANTPAALEMPRCEGLDDAQAAYASACEQLEHALDAERKSHDELIRAREGQRYELTAATAIAAPSQPSRTPWYVLSVVSSLLPALVAAWMVKPTAIRSPAEAQRCLGMPVIGVLPSDLESAGKSRVAA
jgi:hypothetical protein